MKPACLRDLKECHVTCHRSKRNQLRVYPPEMKERGAKAVGRKKTYFVMQDLKAHLPNVMVQGIPTVNRVVIAQEKKSDPYMLYIEGAGGLMDVMGSPGIDGSHTVTNDILEIVSVLGIEAARCVISDEISKIMGAYGIGIDTRHLMLLSDVMTFKGEVLGITRFGVAKMRESVLMLASFEKTTDHLFDAAVHSRSDKIVGVSECIILGTPIPLGTGLFKLLRDNGVRPPETQAQARTKAAAGGGGGGSGGGFEVEEEDNGEEEEGGAPQTGGRGKKAQVDAVHMSVAAQLRRQPAVWTF